ncbi:DUF2231 domain-containing protein [Hymenobacter properus]|uniref:DUF2231 domain-containing protein n=1 Tax=Hymenobacter properus TaxID=2791026 RepID=A0A931BI29_9BACT|nr:DUF2231 domain-containing protein [Hymenobacter properus]MBF9144369.1 hypothetical protein [Hymenobacter properus]MBR7723187.1 hypothetical protein [Microvirga sp. SRT04]
MFSDFPNLHPLVVHVPIVLILLGAALQAVLVFKDWEQVRWGTLLIMAGGFAGALAASTVFHAMPTGLAPRAAAVFAAHEKYASYTLWLSGITLLLRGVGDFFKIQRRAYEILVLAFALAAAGVLSVAGHRGAQLVYVEGVGPQGHLLNKNHGHGHDEADLSHSDRDAGSHDEPAGTGDQAGPSASPQSPTADMPGMDMSTQATAPKAPAKAAAGEMGTMKMADSKPAHPASKAGAMADMPGMNMPAAKTPPSMPKGMDMSRPARPNQQKEMSGMANMPGMKSQSAGAKKPGKAPTEMEGMADMPGMDKGQALPATGAMPGMTMPNPLDKFRFKDNNPARNHPTPKQ